MQPLPQVAGARRQVARETQNESATHPLVRGWEENGMLLYDLFYYDAATGRRQASFDPSTTLPKKAPEGTIARAQCVNGAPTVVWLDANGECARPAWADPTPELRAKIDQLSQSWEVRVSEQQPALRVRVEPVGISKVRVTLDDHAVEYALDELVVDPGSAAHHVIDTWARIRVRAFEVLHLAKSLDSWNARVARNEV